MIIKTNKLLNCSAEPLPIASFQRPRAPSRALEEIYKLPGIALVTPSEASLITQLTESALAVRRCKGEWPRYLKFGRLVRYRLGDLIASPHEEPQ